MLEKPASPTDNLLTLVDNFDIPEDRRLIPETLFALIEILKGIDAVNPNEGSRTLEDNRQAVNDLLAAMQPRLDALIGPLIGAQMVKAEPEAAVRIAEHERIISIIENTADKGEAYDALIALGWHPPLSLERVPMTRDQWANDEFEQSMSKEAERFVIRQIQHGLERLRALFSRFVTKAGTLGQP